MGLASANSTSAIKEGITQIECTINGIGERAGNASLEEVVAIIDTKKDVYNSTTNLDTTKIYKISKIVSKAINKEIPDNKPIVEKNAFKHEAGIHQAGVLKNKETYEILDSEKYEIKTDSIVIGIHSGKNAFIDKMKKLGYEVDEYDIEKIIEEQIRRMEENNNMYKEEEFIDTIKKYKKVR